MLRLIPYIAFAYFASDDAKHPCCHTKHLQKLAHTLLRKTLYALPSKYKHRTVSVLSFLTLEFARSFLKVPLILISLNAVERSLLL